MNPQMMKEIRQEKILSSLDRLGYARRSQLQRIHDLKSNRNACRVLKAMYPYLNTFYDGQNVYYLSKKGADKIGSDKVLQRTQNYQHTLMRNDLYIARGCPESWKNEQIIEVPSKQFKIVTDAFFTDDMGRPYFAEIDRTQNMTENKVKIDKYKQLREWGMLKKRFGNFPKIIWVTTTEARQSRLKALCDRAGLKTDVYLHEDVR